MYKVEVIFNGTPNKRYTFITNFPLEIGNVYDIIADNRQTYNNPVAVVSKYAISDDGARLMLSKGTREITGAKCLQSKYGNAAKDYVDSLSKSSSSTRRPDDGIQKVIFNKEKRTCVVIWKDNVKTILHCNKDDVWDEEKALALAYMKKHFDNRGCFNETLKKWCHIESKVDEQLHPHKCQCKKDNEHICTCNCKEESTVTLSMETLEERVKKEIIKNLTEMWGVNYGS